DRAVRLRYASLFFRVEGNTASLSPQELRQSSLWRCGVLLSPRTLSRTPVTSTTCIEDKDVLFYLVAFRSTGWLGWWQDRRGRQVRDRGRYSPRNHGCIRGSLVP